MFARGTPTGDRTAPHELIRNRDLLAMSNDIGPDYRIVAPRPTPEQPALRGRVSHVRMRPGLYLHSTDVLDLRTMAVQVSLARQLNVVLVLDGEIDVSFDAEHLKLAAAQARRGRGAEGALIAMPEQTLFTRAFHEGRRERKISISVDLAWLANSGLEARHATGSLLDAFADGRLAIARWRPSAKAIVLAEQMHNPPPYAPPLRNLYLESRAIDILTEALLPATGGAPPTERRLRPRDELRMRELRDFLDQNPDLPLSLDAVASRAGSNPSTLQKHFRAAFGMTVFEYLRERNLHRARRALEQDGVSVSMAADIAGYSSAANFATAYRRRFGITPKQSKSWV